MQEPSTTDAMFNFRGRSVALSLSLPLLGTKDMVMVVDMGKGRALPWYYVKLIDIAPPICRVCVLAPLPLPLFLSSSLPLSQERRDREQGMRCRRKQSQARSTTTVVDIFDTGMDMGTHPSNEVIADSSGML